MGVHAEELWPKKIPYFFRLYEDKISGFLSLNFNVFKMTSAATMNTQTCFCGIFVPSLHCSSCCDLRSQPFITSYINHGRMQKTDPIIGASRLVVRGNRVVKCRSTETETLSDGDKEADNIMVTSGSPLQGVKGGVLFKGNLRGSAADTFRDQYKLFLLVNPEDDKPVAVVVPRKTLQPETTAVPEWFAAGAFGLVTVFTLLLRNVPALQTNLLCVNLSNHFNVVFHVHNLTVMGSVFDNTDLLKDGLPGALVTALALGVHEITHILAARRAGVKLGVPYFVPSWQIGSFGAITRILNIIPNREVLLKIAAAGPLAGFSLCLVLLLSGFYLPPTDGTGLVVDASVFHRSFLAGGIAKLFLGDVLKEGAMILVNPLVIWAWAGLLINAINSIPAGELDGGRISFAIWGRKAAYRLSVAFIVLLGLLSLQDDVAFYWVVLIFFLQRGPIAPLAEEISEPDNKYVAMGIIVLVEFTSLFALPLPFHKWINYKSLVI
ncbi:hypothetical protein L1987_78819 [Smallanthus sonchifolius]|uniref:Uncharacterized protein n=1 Tax=Smallanthus sonchifolius TaxID=185202 RepID=A0ACB8ZDZ2_9ASTR|nr:hypothetical protein L1987_78819 [Smallanthus sonchifolius]